MSVNGIDFFNIAKENIKLGSEIGYRMSVGRSYYSMYHSSCAIIRGELPNYASGGKHYSLINYLADSHNGESHNKTKMRVMSYILRQSREKRNRADYDLESDQITLSMAEDQIVEAERIINICNALTKNAA